MKKVVLFAFRGDLMCFVHVMLNALDMKEKGFDIKVVFEGESTKLIPELANESGPMFGLYSDMKQKGLIDAVCKACSAKMNVLGAVEKEGLPLVDEMKGHPSMAKYSEAGYEIITF
jgi:hypothetical protein